MLLCRDGLEMNLETDGCPSLRRDTEGNGSISVKSMKSELELAGLKDLQN